MLVNNGTISSDGGGTITLNLINWNNVGTMSATAGSTLTVNSNGGTWSNTGTISGASGSAVNLANNSGTGSNSGTITTNGGTLSVGGNGTWTNTVTNGITATNGTLSLGGGWSNTGTIHATGSSINLGGTFTTAQALAIQHSGTTTITITGTMDNTGTTLPLGPLTGSWFLSNGTITGGTITGTANERLVGTNTTNVLDGVTLAAGMTLDLAAVNGATCFLQNAVTVNGTVLIGSADGSTFGRVHWSTPTTTWTGSGSFLFGGSGSNSITSQAGNTTLTLGSNLTIHGTAGNLNANDSGSVLINNGVISSDGGGTFTLNLVTFTNNGTMVIGSGAKETWSCSGNFTQSATGILVIEIGGTSAGQFDRLSFGGSSTINLGGTVKILSTGGFTPSAGTSVDIITTSGGAVSGSAPDTTAYTLTYGASKVTAVGRTGLTAPTVALTSLAGDPVLASPIPVTATFSVPVTGLTLAGLSPTNATVANLAGSGATYTFDLIPTITQGSVGVVVSAGAATSAGDLSNAISNSFARLFNGVDPTITTISPATGTTLGGTPVVISGTGFITGSTQVFFGGVAAAGVTANAGSISCTTPSGAAGSVDVQVVVAGRSATSVAGYAYAIPAAADIVFTGAPLSSWGVGTNWSTGLVPNSGQKVDIPAGKSCLLDVATQILASVTVEGTLTVSAKLQAGSLINNGVVQLNGGTMRVDAVSGSLLTATNASNTLDAVALDADLDLTQFNGAQVTITNTVTLGNGRTILVGSADGSRFGSVFFSGSVATLASAGASSVVFGSSTNNQLRDSAGSTAMVIGSGVTVTGGAGNVFAVVGGSTLLIAGTIDAGSPAKMVTVGNNADLTTITATGTLKASLGILNLGGSWTSSGTIVTQTGTVNLGGAFDFASVLGARWNRSGTDAVNLTGVLTIGVGNTLTLDAQTGSWQVLGGTLKDGTLSDAGSRLVFTSTAGVLDGVTIPVGTVIDLGLSNGAQCFLNNSLTVNGTIKVGRTDGLTFGRVFWNSASATWGGSGDILFGASSSNAWTAQSGAGALTIAAPLLIHGQNVTINATSGGSSIINNGTLVTDVAGGNFPFTANAFTNNGTIIVGQDSFQNWSCGKNFTQSASGVLELEIGGTGVGQADRLAFSGTSSIVLDGTLRLVSANAFVPTPATAVDVITIAGGSVTGAFATVQGGYSVSYGATKVTAVGAAGLIAPGVTLTSTAGDPTTVVPIPLQATFSAAVTGLVATDLIATNATISGFSGSGTTYTFNLTPTVIQGTVGVSIPAGAASDAQLLGNPASAPFLIFYNGIDPTIAVNGVSPASGTSLGGAPVTITGTGFVPGATSVTFGGVEAAVGLVTATSIACTTPAGSAGTTVDVQVTTAGRSVTAVAAYTYSALNLPGISGIAPPSGVRAGGTAVTITGANLSGTTAVTFNGVAATGVTVVDSTTVTCVTPALAGPNPRPVDVILTTGVGSTTAVGGFFYGNAPTVVVSPDAIATNSFPITFTMTFSTAVSGFDSFGLTVTNGEVGSVTGSGTTYSVNVTPTGEGAVTLTVNPDAAFDVHALGNVASNVASVVFDSTAPTVVITPDGVSSTASPIVFDLAFSEPVAGLIVGGLTIGNGTAGVITVIDAAHYTVPITPTGPGPVTLAVGAASVTDGAGNTNAPSNTATVTFVVNSDPTVVVNSAASSTNVSPIVFTLTFSAPVTGLTASGLAVVNGSSGTISGSGTTYTVPVTPAADGTVTLQVKANAAIDTSSLGNVISNVFGVVFDSTAPTVMIAPDATVVTASPITFTLAFSEPVTGLVTPNVTNGTAGAATVVDATHMTVPVTPTAPGTVTVTLPAGAVTDAVGNANAAASASVTFAVDPTVVVSTVASPTGASPIAFTLTFSAPVTGLTASGLTVTNGSIGTIGGSGTTYTVPVTPTADGVVSLQVKANAAIDGNSLGNVVSNLASVFSDRTPPTLAITPASGSTGTSPIIFSLAFSEPVTGLASNGLTIGNGNAGTITVIDAAHYTVPVTPAAAGVVTIALQAGAVSDLAGNANALSSTASLTFVTASPTVVVGSTPATTNASPIIFTLTFSTAVTGLTTGGLTVTNGLIGAISGSGAAYTVPVTPAADGAVTLQVNAAAAIDTNSLVNLASNVASVAYDTTAPTVVITPTGGSTTASPISFTLTFSEPVTGLTASGLAVGNGVLGALSGSGASYTVPVTPIALGTVTLSLNVSAASDAAGNPNAASAPATIDFNSVITFQAIADAVGIVGQPLLIPVVADSTAAQVPVAIGAETDLATLGLTLTATANGRALLSGQLPLGLAVGPYAISLTATDGTSNAVTSFTLTVVSSTPAVVPQPTVPVTEPTQPGVYSMIGLSTPQGIQSVLAALAGKDKTQVRAFVFDGSSQSYVELPAEPAGGLTVYHGVFIASRIALPISLGGTPVPLPAVLVLQPGWNLLCVPPIQDVSAADTGHPWNCFQLQTEDGVPVGNPADLIGTPGGPLTSTEPYHWNGETYDQVTTLTTGVGYWFKNNGAQPLRLVRTAAQVNGPGAVRGFALRSGAAVRLQAVHDRGTPPAPPEMKASKADSSGGGCGVGSGMAIIGLALLSFCRRRLAA